MAQLVHVLAQTGELALSLDESLLLLAQVNRLHLDDSVQVVHTGGLHLDLVANVLKLSIESSCITAQFVVEFVEASDFSNLMGSVGFNSFDFLLKAGESGAVLVNLVLLHVRVLTRFMAVQALVAEHGLQLVEFAAERALDAVLLLDAALDVAEAVLGVVDVGADLVASHAEVTIVLLLVVAQHAESVLSSVDFLSNRTDFSVVRCFHAVKLSAEVSDNHVLLVEVGRWAHWWCVRDRGARKHGVVMSHGVVVVGRSDWGAVVHWRVVQHRRMVEHGRVLSHWGVTHRRAVVAVADWA